MKYFQSVYGSHLLLAGLTSLAFSKGWEPVIDPTPLVPDYVLAVDKEAQKLHLLVHKSPFHAEASFTCATGQVAGDKVVEGDLKTPEGIYFTTGKKDRPEKLYLIWENGFPFEFS